MCGLAGAMVFRQGTFRVTEPYIERMRDTMAHRGPDGVGVWVSQDHTVGLGHRRLSIIDLSSAASQPMSSPDEKIWLVYNGEIYNHADVRRELMALGHAEWKTDHSDTEVIIRAYQQWGVECLHRLRGMFAIALWDDRKQELWLARDRLGIKPLYYSVHDERVVFASEIKALLHDPDQRREVDEQALFHYFSFLTTPAPQTLFAGVHKLEAGTWIRIGRDGTLRKSRYWDPFDGVEPRRTESEETLSAALLEQLRTAVKLRKVSDVPVGVFLSGGIDSSTNAALFSEGEERPVRTFSIGYDADYSTYPNELPYARMMAERVGAEHHEKLLTANDLVDFLPRMTWLQDEPIADPVCVPVYYVSKLARESGVTVCQLGEGADELFYGYPGWRTLLRLQRFDDVPVPRLFKRGGLVALSLAGRAKGMPYEWLRRGSLGQPVFWGGAEAFSDVSKRALLSARLRSQFRDLTSWDAIAPIRARFEERAWERSHFNWMCYLDLNLRLPELLLMRVDKMSMGVGLEARVPFLDHRLVQFAMSVPTTVKTRDNQLKSLLKRSVRGLIPDAIIDRKKQGFGVPVYEWFSGRLGTMARAELESFCAQTDFLDRDAVRALVSSGNGPLTWYVLNFALWWRQYIAGPLSAP